MKTPAPQPALEQLSQFPLVDALLGRRSRRFFLGANIPDGPFAYESQHAPVPLSEFETLVLLTAMAGNTGWHYLIMHNARYAPRLPNYAGAAGGRVFPSAAGFHTSNLFYSDDNGVYLFDTRDAPALAGAHPQHLESVVEAHRGRLRKIYDGRLQLPPSEPHIEGHNVWVVNQPGTVLVMPVADLAQHALAALAYFLQNGYCIYDDLNKRAVPGLERFSHLCDLANPLPLSFVEHYTLMEATTELSTCCYAGVLMLQAMGLGGWMFNGINPYSILGASGEPNARGLGFRFDVDERWPLPNPTGLPGIFEALCPPHYPTMREALEALEERKFGKGGPFHPETPGPWKASAEVRSKAAPWSEEFKECVSLQAQYLHDSFGRFPATTPSVLTFMYLQAHHLDLDFYDRFFEPGSYLQTHAEHMRRWHAP